MKKILFFFFLINLVLSAQKVTVVENVAVTTPEEGSFYFPTLSPDGGSILFSSVNLKGLWLKDLSSGNIIKITDAASAGYDPGFNGSEIIYREDSFVSGRRKSSLYSYNRLNGQELQIESDVRNLKISRNYDWKCYLYIKENRVEAINKNSSLQKYEVHPTVYIDNSNIVLISDENKKVLMPLGEGNYIWPSVSPKGDKLLFTKAGDGTYISDLYGNILAELGKADYPSWSPDGNWIVYMEDYDDGEKIISSFIGVVKADGTAKQRLTKDKDGVSIFPKWGGSDKEVFFNTEKGQIRKLKLNFE